MEIAKKVLKQTSWQILGKIISSLSTLVILGIVTRSYGEFGTGVYTLALTYLGFFFLAADLGLNGYILPRLYENLNEANLLFNFRLLWSIILLILSNLIVFILPLKSEAFNQSVFLGSVSIVFSGIFNSSNLIFQNKLRYDQSIFAQSLGSICSMVVIFYLNLYRVPIIFLAFGPLFGWVINGFASLILVAKLYKFKLKFPNINYPINTLKAAWPISLTLLLNVIYFRADAFILSGYHAFKEVGTYNLAYQVFSNMIMIPTFIMNGFYPIMLRSLNISRKLFVSQIKAASMVLFLISILVTIIIWFLSPLIIKILTGGGFNGSDDVLKILSLGFPAYFVSALYIWTLVSLKKYKTMLLVYLLGLIINVVLNSIFIPSFSFIAAAWITGISEYLILFLQLTIILNEFSKDKKPKEDLPEII